MAIIKHVELVLTQEEINSPEPIEIQFTVREKDFVKTNDDDIESVTYTIKYPKSK